MRSVLVCAILAVASAEAVAVSSIPPAFDYRRALQNRMAKLDARGKEEFWKHQAELAKRIPNAAELERQHLSKRTLNPTQLVPRSVVEMDWAEAERMERRAASANAPAKKPVVCTPIKGEVPKYLIGKSYATCLSNTSTRDVDDPKWGLQVGTKTKWADGHVPKSLRGIFYMEGSPFASEVFSTGRATWNSTLKVWDMPSYGPKFWSSDNNDDGLEQWQKFRTTGSTQRSWCAEGSLDGRSDLQSEGRVANGTVCRTENYLSNLGFNFSWGEYWSFQQDPNYHIRQTVEKWLFHWENGSNVAYNYNLWRIVDDKGVRTPYFYSRYLANINKTVGWRGQQNVHLTEELIIPQEY